MSTSRNDNELELFRIKYIQICAEKKYHKPSPLFVACKFGFTSVVKTFLAPDSKMIDSKNDITQSLYVAAEHGHDEIADLLLEHGAHPDNGYYENPLRIASEEGHIEIVRKLLAAGAKKEITNALYRVASKGEVEIAELLLEHGAQVNAIWHYTVYEAGFLVGTMVKVDTTSLHQAVRYGHAEMVRLFLQNNADTTIKDSSGMIPLHIAASEGNLGIVKQLLKAKASGIDSTMVDGNTPLSLALEANHTAVVKKLIKCGASITPRCIKLLTKNENVHILYDLLNQQKFSKEISESFAHIKGQLLAHIYSLPNDKQIKALRNALKEDHCLGQVFWAVSGNFSYLRSTSLEKGKLAEIAAKLKTLEDQVQTENTVKSTKSSQAATPVKKMKTKPEHLYPSLSEDGDCEPEKSSTVAVLAPEIVPYLLQGDSSKVASSADRESEQLPVSVTAVGLYQADAKPVISDGKKHETQHKRLALA